MLTVLYSSDSFDLYDTINYVVIWVHVSPFGLGFDDI